MVLEYLKACIYGIIEGITEWLPISSTGHLILFERILALDLGMSEEFSRQYLAMFDVVIQLGAILAVVFLYFGRLFSLGKQRKDTFSLWRKLFLATLPAALIGLLADLLCERFLERSLDSLLFTPQTVASALIVYGILFVLVEKLTAKDTAPKEVSSKTALAVGCFQALAIIPGTSRSGATILGARILGVPREKAAEFSFLAAIPVISAASLLKFFDFFSYLSASGEAVGINAVLILLCAGAVAFSVSLLTVGFLTDFVRKHSFIPFGIYRIALGIAVLIFIK
jgi:undecaprenyl-diphosphatase